MSFDDEALIHKLALTAVIGVVVIGVLAWVINPDSAGHAEYLGEKRGRMLDAHTNAGIADMDVVVSWHTTATSVFGTRRACQAVRVVKTDANGDFVVPDMSAQIQGERPLGNRIRGLVELAYSWRLMAVKTGYVHVVDQQEIANPPSAMAFFPAWASDQPRASRDSGHWTVAPVYFENKQLTPSEAYVYESALRRSIECDTHEDASLVAIKQRLQ
jgi:hypothetical protein